jgi:hypothetical protein
LVDISSLHTFEDKIELKDITVPAGVTLRGAPEAVVALVSEAKEEVIEETPEAPDLSTIEVEKRGKEEVLEGEGTEESKKE